MIYLAGVIEGGSGILGTDTLHPVHISQDEVWPDIMAKTFGGESMTFVSKHNRTVHGWAIPQLKERYLLFEAVAKAGTFWGIDSDKAEAIRVKLEKHIPLEQRDWQNE